MLHFPRLLVAMACVPAIGLLLGFRRQEHGDLRVRLIADALRACASVCDNDGSIMLQGRRAAAD